LRMRLMASPGKKIEKDYSPRGRIHFIGKCLVQMGAWDRNIRYLYKDI
jgi:hypothetical protein